MRYRFTALALAGGVLMAGCNGGTSSAVHGAVHVDCPETVALHQAAGLSPYNKLEAFEGDPLTVKDAAGAVVASVRLQGLTGEDGTPAAQLPSIREANAAGVSLMTCLLPFEVSDLPDDFVSFELRGVEWTGIPVEEAQAGTLMLRRFESASWRVETEDYEPPAT
jgi:hypothetical protein